MKSKICQNGAICTLAGRAESDVKYGIKPFTTTNMNTGETTLRGFSHNTRNEHTGILFNYCPWCGADLRPMMGLKDE